MAAKRAIHPTEDTLRAFALGKLDDAASAALLTHLDSCSVCWKIVASLSGDDFLHRLRQAQGHSITPAPAESLSEAANPTPIANLPPELAANQQYEILRELGRGGMGVVYLAKNKPMDRLEVLKVINRSLLDRPGAVERFLREIRSAAQLNHTNVVAAYSVLQLGEMLAFAMEYVEGEDLAQFVKSRGPLPVLTACAFIQQAALGLHHAHAKKMVHRDIKPHNLMLTREGKKTVVKILDFGLAKATRDENAETGITGDGTMLGTPDYIAPEQALDAARADIRADIYSLGCTLYFLLAGAPPFSGKGISAVLLAHQSLEARPLNLVRPEVPEELAAVVRKMMAKDPSKRYQTPAEVVQALHRFGKLGTKEATMKPSLDLSMGDAAVPPAQPSAPRTPAAKRQAAATASPPPVVPDKPREDSPPPVPLRRREAIGKRRPPPQPSSNRRWLIGGGVGVAVLLLGLLGMWLGGVSPRKLWDSILKDKGNGLPNSEYDLTAGFRFVDFHSVNPRVVMTYNDPMQEQFFARVYDLATGKAVCQPLRHLQPVTHAAFSPDGKRVVTASADHTAQVWDVESGKALPSHLKHDQTVNHVTFSPDGQRVATACADNTAQLWDAWKGEALCPPLKHDGAVNYVTFGPDSTRLITVSEDKTAKVWDAGTGKSLVGPLQHSLGVNCAAFSPDGERVVTASTDNTARVWDARTGQALSQPLHHDNTIWHVEFSPDGLRFVTASQDNTAQVWDAIKFHSLKLSIKHSQRVRRASFSLDGKRVVTVSDDNTVRVWDAVSDQAVSRPLPHDTSVIHAAFSPDGKRVVTIAADNTARLWDAEKGEELKKVTIAPD